VTNRWLHRSEPPSATIHGCRSFSEWTVWNWSMKYKFWNLLFQSILHKYNLQHWSVSSGSQGFYATLNGRGGNPHRNPPSHMVNFHYSIHKSHDIIFIEFATKKCNHLDSKCRFNLTKRFNRISQRSSIKIESDTRIFPGHQINWWKTAENMFHPYLIYKHVFIYVFKISPILRSTVSIEFNFSFVKSS